MTRGETVADGHDGAAEQALRIDVLRGDPTAEELAAVIAVVTESYALEVAAAVADDRPRRSAWQLSARPLRAPLARELGWGRFGG
ncbi:acyl-CoA carboxylase subunit epsilon [Microbacterium sp.]|uniref:acyl-CoA carboxylase subunit epsilon n=1 Tax=Microbacterium sp. TaxID=51671 RepID=UPI0039E4EB10